MKKLTALLLLFALTSTAFGQIGGGGPSVEQGCWGWRNGYSEESGLSNQHETVVRWWYEGTTGSSTAEPNPIVRFGIPSHHDGLSLLDYNGATNNPIVGGDYEGDMDLSQALLNDTTYSKTYMLKKFYTYDIAPTGGNIDERWGNYDDGAQLDFDVVYDYTGRSGPASLYLFYLRQLESSGFDGLCPSLSLSNATATWSDSTYPDPEEVDITFNIGWFWTGDYAHWDHSMWDDYCVAPPTRSENVTIMVQYKWGQYFFGDYTWEATKLELYSGFLDGHAGYNEDYEPQLEWNTSYKQHDEGERFGELAIITYDTPPVNQPEAIKIRLVYVVSDIDAIPIHKPLEDSNGNVIASDWVTLYKP